MARFRDGQEEQSGTIRRDPAGTCGRRDDPGISEETWRASSDDTPGDRQRDPTGAEEARTAAAERGASEGCHRRHSGGRSAGSPEAAAYRTSDLGAPARGAPGASHRGANGAALRAAAQAGTGTRRTPSVRAAKLGIWAGSAGRLVRGRRDTGR